jgi:hypothetical protein
MCLWIGTVSQHILYTIYILIFFLPYTRLIFHGHATRDTSTERVIETRDRCWFDRSQFTSNLLESDAFAKRSFPHTTMAPLQRSSSMNTTTRSSASLMKALAVPYTRRRVTPEQLKALNNLFDLRSHPSREERATLASEMSM